MHSLKKRVIDFLEDYDTEYQNPHGATILLFDDLTVHVQIKYPGYECRNEDALEFICSCESLEAFFCHFTIKDIKDLGKIKLSHFEELYTQGKAQIFCMVGNYELTFKKSGEAMDIYDCRGIMHKLHGLLYTGEDFINYTSNYYNFSITHPG